MSSKSWDKRFLELAQFISQWSKDPSTQVGAVIVDQNNRIVSLGFNGFPKNISDDSRLQNREQKYSIIVHAECNAIMFSRSSLEGCTIYTYPFQPCSKCAGLIIQSGIKRVVTIPLASDYNRWAKDFDVSYQLLVEAGLNVSFMNIET